MSINYLEKISHIKPQGNQLTASSKTGQREYLKTILYNLLINLLNSFIIYSKHTTNSLNSLLFKNKLRHNFFIYEVNVKKGSTTLKSKNKSSETNILDICNAQIQML